MGDQRLAPGWRTGVALVRIKVMLKRLSVTGVGLLAVGGGVPPVRATEPADLAALVGCHDRAVGGRALRAASGVEYELELVEPGFTASAVYRAWRPASMRIDVFVEGERVFSEGLAGGEAWKLPGGATERQPTDPEGAAALWHGVERPGHLWTLADMTARGHELELVDRETTNGARYAVLELTLSDGFQTWYWLDEASCRIVKSRDFRAFHPDLDPERVWVETIFEDFRTTDGVTRAHRSRNVDLATGETLGTTTVVAVRLDPPRSDPADPPGGATT